MDTLTCEVICPLIPGYVKPVITEYNHMSRYRIFQQMFEYHVLGVANWERVVAAYETAKTEYEELVTTLENGRFNI